MTRVSGEGLFEAATSSRSALVRSDNGCGRNVTMPTKDTELRPKSLNIRRSASELSHVVARALQPWSQNGAILSNRLTTGNFDGPLCDERRQAVRVDSFRLVGAARQLYPVRSPDAAFLIQLGRRAVSAMHPRKPSIFSSTPRLPISRRRCCRTLRG